jgi:hypothetical protein
MQGRGIFPLPFSFVFLLSQWQAHLSQSKPNPELKV